MGTDTISGTVPEGGLSLSFEMVSVPIFFLILGFPVFGQEATSSTEPVHFVAGRLLYNEDRGQVEFLDKFKLTRSSQSLTGDRAIYDLNTKMGEAWDNLEYNDPNIRLLGSHLTLDTYREYFHWMGNTKGFFTRAWWRFEAKELEGSSDFYLARRVNFTSCDRVPPHYHVWSWRGKIYPGRKAAFNHAILHVGPVPFFYLPYYAKSLGDEPRPTIYLNPGVNGREGMSVRSVVGYPLGSRDLYLRTHIDWMKKIGLGLGPEVLFRRGENHKGALYLYTIQEKNGLRHWDARGDGFSQLTNRLNLQSSFRYMRDPNFNNLYFRENFERVTPEVKSSLALNWTWSRGFFRAYYNDRFNFDENEKKFRSMDLSVPGLETTLYPTPLTGSSLYLQGSAAANLRYTRSSASQIEPFERWEDRGTVRLSQPWKIPYVPIAGEAAGFVGTSFASRVSPTNFKDTTRNNYGAELKTNVQGIPGLDFTFSYLYGLRTRENSLHQDTSDPTTGVLNPDGGVDTNRLEGLLIGSLPLGAYMMARSAYSFRHLKGSPPVRRILRMEPVWGMLSVPLAQFGSASFSTNYTLYGPQGPQYVHNFSYSLVRDLFAFYGGVVYDNSKPNVAIPSVRGSVRVPFLFNSFVTYTLSGEYLAKGEALTLKKEKLTFFDREIVINPDFHDFLFAVTLRARKDVREMYLAIRLKLSADADEKFRRHLQEKEFYPWR